MHLPQAHHFEDAEQDAKGLQRLHSAFAPGVGCRHQHAAAHMPLAICRRARGGRGLVFHKL